MRTGQRNQPVVIIFREQTGVSDLNEPTYKDRILAEVLAGMEDRRGEEQFEAGQRFSETITRFHFDYFDVEQMTEQMQIKHKPSGRIYQIKNILRDHERHMTAVADCYLQA